MALTGLFGGTFDPPHVGHVGLARTAGERFGLDRLLVAPTGRTPGKRVATDPEIRLALAEAAFADVPCAEVSRLDVDRPQPAYSYETVRWARERFGDILFLVGADRFVDFLTWERPNEVLRIARLAVATRPGFDRTQLDSVLAAVERPDQVEFFEIEPAPVSSTEIRRRVAAGQAIAGLVPPAVGRLIEELGLYREPQVTPLH
ncbi:MAG: nicotinate (nicotinamide) nucleotide adenylyltransferase [Gaiellaceae bacterium]